MILPAPKFIANSADGMHCGPAVWRMILESYFPDQSWTYDKIDQIIQKEPGKYTWAQTFHPTMLDAGISLTAISTWDDAQFIERTWDYVRERSGAASANAQEEHAQDLNFVKSAMKNLLADDRIKHHLRPATWSDLSSALNDGAYVSCTINSRVINEREGFNSHTVLVYGVDDTSVHLQDPGPLNAGSRTVNRDLFDKAWAFNGPDVRSLVAYKNRAA